MQVLCRAAILLAAVGLASESALAQSASRLDSAGVAIVTNEVPLTAGQVLRMSESPVLQIGDATGAAYMFDGVIAAFRLRAGGIVVGDRGSGQLRVFDPQGRVVRILGRRGNGPGEFRTLAHVWPTGGDSVRAWDGRLSTFSLSSHEIRTQVPSSGGDEPAPRLAIVRGTLADESLLAVRRRVAPVPAVERAVRDTLEVWHLDRSGVLIAPVARFPANEILKGADGNMVGPTGTEQAAFSMRGAPYALDTHLAAAQDALLSTSPAGAAEWQIRALDGRLRSIVRVRRPRIPVTSEVVRRHRAEADQDLRHISLAALPVARNLPRERYPSHLPAYSALRVDAVGRVWARQMAVEAAEPERWDVFHPDGSLIDIAVMPPRFTPLDAGLDYVLGVWRDHDDVEHVRLYRLAERR